ncbi:methyltransferase domain-containing protein [Mesorhizobium sp. M0293]|uniref:class I SAM-dependent methyltransferase n=1 Tax=Mesorhizobium sp. M0293 TaxID=2956930 RepID=UPI003337375A
MYNDDLFEGATPYYRRFRPDYPAELLAALNGRLQSLENRRVLDLGCGTGLLGRPIAAFATEVVCVDPDPEMLKEAESSASKDGVQNIQFVRGRLADLRADYGVFDAVTMGQSFHYMDREGTLSSLNDQVSQHGFIAIVDKERTASEPGDWFQPLWDFVDAWNGGKMAAGKQGTRQPLPYPHIETLRASAFSRVETLKFDYEWVWNIEALTGYVLSTSRACPGVLGDRKDQFISGLDRFLREFSDAGIFHERGYVVADIAVRP